MLRSSEKRLHIGERLPRVFAGRDIRRYPEFKAARLSGPTVPPVTGYAGWYDLSDTSTLTLSGQLISSVADKSGNANTATGTNSPFIGIDPQSGRTVALFGSSGQLDTGLTSSSRTFTAVMVAMARTTATAALLGPSSDGANELRLNSSGQLETLRADVASLAAQSNANATSGVPFVAAQLLTAADITHYVRAGGSTTSETDANVTAFTASQILRIGRAPTTGGNQDVWTGWIGEVIIYTSSLAGSDVTALIDYLRTKWGIA